MSVAAKSQLTAKCALAIAIPMSEREVFHDLGQPEQHDYAKAMRGLGEVLSEEGVWESHFRPVVNPQQPGIRGMSVKSWKSPAPNVNDAAICGSRRQPQLPESNLAVRAAARQQ